MLRSIRHEFLGNQLIAISLGALGLILGLALSSTYTEADALQADAARYWRVAQDLSAGAPLLAVSSSPRGVDVGYPAILASALMLFGNTVRVGQIANVVMFGITSLFYFLAIQKLAGQLGSPLRSRRQFLLPGMFFLSPLFLTFSGKLFSEITAALGVALLVCSIIYLWSTDESQTALLSRPYWSASMIIGCSLFVVTKSAFFPLLILYAVLFMILKKRSLARLTLISMVICLPFYVSAQRGGRGSYNFAIQIAKLQWSYPEIAASAVYYYSDTLGKTVLPSYADLLQQNPGPDTVVDRRNAYVLAVGLRDQGFSYVEGFESIAKDPLRYLAVALGTLPAMIAVEGVYPAIGNLVPYPVRLALWIVLKQALSLALWSGLLLLVRRQRRNPLVIVLVLPIIYFVVVYGNFSLEQRWFFPLLPLLWLLGSTYFSMVLEGTKSEGRRAAL